MHWSVNALEQRLGFAGQAALVRLGAIRLLGAIGWLVHDLAKPAKIKYHNQT
jgi:hypothetical protein